MAETMGEVSVSVSGEVVSAGCQLSEESALLIKRVAWDSCTENWDGQLTTWLSERLLDGLAESFSVHPAFRLFGRNFHDRTHLGL
jgi:hypothetical protein